MSTPDMLGDMWGICKSWCVNRHEFSDLLRLEGSLADHRWSWAWWLASRVSYRKLLWPKGCRRRQFLSFFWRNGKEWMEWLEEYEAKWEIIWWYWRYYEDAIWRERERLDLESLSYCGFGVSISGEVGDSFVDTAEPMSHFRLGMASPLLSCRCLELDEFRRCRRARIVSTSWNSSKHSNCRNLTNLVLQNIRCCKVCQDWFRFIPWCQVLEQFWWVWWHLGWLQICWSASQRPCCLGYKG